MIELKELPLVKADEPLSKGIALLLKPSPIVGVLEGNNLIGVLDDRHLSIRAKDASQIKCSSVSIKCHKIKKIGSIEHLIKIFANEHFKALPVVGKDNRPVGYYSRSEILKAIVDKGLLPDVSITDIMSAPIYTIDSNATLGEAKARMKELGVKRLTVLENGRLIGVISSFDLIALKIKPKQRQSMQLVKEVKNIENTKVKELLREPLLIVAKTDRL
ncbi:MAG: CBS domain-containing protein [Candidatus Anstonellales archaeon]